MSATSLPSHPGLVTFGFRQDFVELLGSCSLSDETVRRAKACIQSLIAAKEEFGGANGASQLTGSALVANADRSQALLNRHAKLDKWIQFGAQ
jgi:hypothetical protein